MLWQQFLSGAGLAGGLGLFGLLGSVAVAQGPAVASLAPGTVLFTEDFEDQDVARRWGKSAKLAEGHESAHAFGFELAAADGSVGTRVTLPVERMRGCSLWVSAWVKAEGVSNKPESWNGIKVMLPITGPQGASWPQATLETGTFGWKKASFNVRVPEDAQTADLFLGLEKVSDKVRFDDVRVSVRKPPVTTRARAHFGSVETGHAVPRLRGVMIQPGIDTESLRVLGQDWKANLIRWQLVRPGSGRARVYEQQSYDEWLEGELKRLDAALPKCREYGLTVVVDLHSPPGGAPISGGYVAANAGLFANPAAQDHFVEVWRRMAARFKGEPAIWGFDLVNEPVEDTAAEGLDDWHGLAERAGKAIREVDPSRLLIVEPPDWGNPNGLIGFEPLALTNVVYSVHMYLPHTFTHQGVGRPGQPVVYPGRIDGRLWDKAALEAALQPIVTFQKTYGVAIYMGEFSAIRWAPDNSAFRYLSDVIDLFELHGWDWSYHAFREWQGWSVEHGSDPKDTKPSATPTDRQKLLQRWFALNQKPAFTTAPALR